MGTMPTAIQTYGPSLLGAVAFGLLNLFNTVNADLAHLRHEVTALQCERIDYAIAAEVEAELGTPDAAPPAPASPEPTYFAMR
jgi:hypothetical protein